MLSLAQHKVGRTSKQSEGTVCACAQPQVKDTGAPATGDTWAQGRPVSLSCRQTPWATAFHSREAPGPSLALALGFSPPQLEQVPGVCRTGDRAQVPSIWADPRLSLTDALHPQPAPHKVPRAVPGRRRGGHDAAGVSGVCGWRGGQGSPWGGGHHSWPGRLLLRRGPLTSWNVSRASTSSPVKWGHVASQSQCVLVRAVSHTGLIKSQAHHLLAGRPWADHFAFLCLSFSSARWGWVAVTVRVPAPWRGPKW